VLSLTMWKREDSFDAYSVVLLLGIVRVLIVTNNQFKNRQHSSFQVVFFISDTDSDLHAESRTRVMLLHV
jgi:hypothetical protein